MADKKTDLAAVKLLDAVYAPILSRETPRLVYGLESAELVKVAANSFLATKISFINAIADICEATGVDVTEVAEAIGLDDRIGKKFLRSGIGFGGGCLPKDIRAFMARAHEAGVSDSFRFLKEVDNINLSRRSRIPAKLVEMIGTLDSAKITVLGGAAFKPDSDDIRDSPAIDIALRLVEAGADVTVHDPEALENVRRAYPQLKVAQSLEGAVNSARAVLILTEWEICQDADPSRLGSIVSSRTLIDGRQCVDAERWRSAGWRVYSPGRTFAIE